MSSLTVCAYLWFDPAGEHNDQYVYSVKDVALLKRMVDRHLSISHDFLCLTNMPHWFAGSGIRTAPIDDWLMRRGDYAPQLMPFHPDAERLIGSRILTLDLDCAIVGELDSIVGRGEELVLWRNPARQPWANPTGKGARRPLYNLSMTLVTAGSRLDIWNNTERWKAGLSQNYVSAMVGPDSAYWDDSDGVYRLERDDTPGSGIRHELPENARVVFFVGDQHKPWLPAIQERCPWVAEHRI